MHQSPTGMAWHSQQTPKWELSSTPVSCFKSFHGILGERHPLRLPAGPFPSMILTERLCNVCKPLHGPPVVAHQTEKSVYLHVGLWWGRFCNGFQVQVAGVELILQDSI